MPKGAPAINDVTRGDPWKARAVGVANERHRIRVIQCLRDGHLTLAEFRTMRATDKRLNCLRVRAVMYACVGGRLPLTDEGKQRGETFLRQLKLDPEKRVSQLTPREWQRFVGRVDSARPRTA